MWFDPLEAYPVSYFMEDIEIKGMVISRGSTVSFDDLPLFFSKNGKWAFIRKEFSNLKSDNILHNSEAGLKCGPFQERKLRVVASSPKGPKGLLNFSVDEAGRGKPSLVSIGGVFCKSKGKVPFMLSKNEAVKDSNKAQMIAILEVL